MKLRLPILITKLLFLPLISTAQAISVSNWDEFKNSWNGGNTSFELTGTLETPLFIIPSSGFDPNIDTSIPLSSAVLINLGNTLTINGQGNIIGFENIQTAPVNEIARPIFNGGSLIVNDVAFQYNFTTASGQMKAGAIYAADKSTASFTNTTFRGNHLSATTNGIERSSGGAYFNGSSNMMNITTGAYTEFNQCLIDENFINIHNTLTNGSYFASATGEGGFLINNYRSRVLINGSTIQNNYVSVTSLSGRSIAQGGAIFNDGTLTINDTSFLNNKAINIEINPNPLDAGEGGALYNTLDGILTITNSLFKGNSVLGNSNNKGGAIYNTNNTKTLLVDCIFEDNYVERGLSSSGGAIQDNSSRGDFHIVAKNRDSYFRGNKIKTDIDGNSGSHNAITFASGAFGSSIAQFDFKGSLIANNGKAINEASVIFYDPIAFQRTSNSYFNFNRSESDGTIYEGKVIFTGEDFITEEDPTNRNSYANDKTYFVQHNGSLVVKEKAILGSKSHAEYNVIGAKSYELKKGNLEILTDGHLLATTMTLNTDNNWRTAIIKSDSSGKITTDTLNITQGISFDFNPFIPLHNSGLQVSAGVTNLGGSLGIIDYGLDYYMDTKWANSQKFLALNFINPDDVINGNFDDALSAQFGTSVIDSAYFYKGEWSYEWITNDAGNKELYAVWTPKVEPTPDPGPTPDPDPTPAPGPTPEPNPGIQEILPELAGDIVPNTLWTTRSNLQSVSDLALGQIGPHRYKLDECANYWASALGDFDKHQSSGKRDGFDYSGYGYAVGTDTRICPNNWLLGVAFGNFYGKTKSRNFNANVDQTSYIGTLYTGWLKEIDANNSFNLTASASYGLTTNNLTTHYSDGKTSQGNWDNEGLRLTLNGEWNHNLGDQWTLTPFIGLEYDDLTQKAFSESGERPRHFGDSTLRNLALPIGLGITNQKDFSNGVTWLNSARLAYIPDIFRKNPEGHAQRLTSDGFSWNTKGIDPDRHAVRAEYSTRVAWNETWSTFAGYSVEFRKDAVNQNAHIGVSATF